MSKITLGQRKFPTLGLRSQQPKNYVGPTLSCYLGTWLVWSLVTQEIRVRILFDLKYFSPRNHNNGDKVIR